MSVIIVTLMVAAAGLDPGSFNRTSTRSRVVKSSRFDKTLARCANFFARRAGKSPRATCTRRSFLLPTRFTAPCCTALSAPEKGIKYFAILSFEDRRRSFLFRCPSGPEAARDDPAEKSLSESDAVLETPPLSSFPPPRASFPRPALPNGAGVGVSGGRFWSPRATSLRLRAASPSPAHRASTACHSGSRTETTDPFLRSASGQTSGAASTWPLLLSLWNRMNGLESFCLARTCTRSSGALNSRHTSTCRSRIVPVVQCTRRHNRPTRMNTTRLDVVSASQWSASTTKGTKMPIASDYHLRARDARTAGDPSVWPIARRAEIAIPRPVTTNDHFGAEVESIAFDREDAQRASAPRTAPGVRGLRSPARRDRDFAREPTLARAPVCPRGGRRTRAVLSRFLLFSPRPETPRGERPSH